MTELNSLSHLIHHTTLIKVRSIFFSFLSCVAKKCVYYNVRIGKESSMNKMTIFLFKVYENLFTWVKNDGESNEHINRILRGFT